jgi:hypothetical protein
MPGMTPIVTVTSIGGDPFPGTGEPFFPTTGTPGAITEHHGDIYNWLSTAAAEVDNLPGQFTGYVPSPDGTSFFGYAKWVMSCSSAQELLGQTLAPIACHTFVGFTLFIVMMSVYLSIRIISVVLKIVTWVVQQILRLVPLIG